MPAGMDKRQPLTAGTPSCASRARGIVSTRATTPWCVCLPTPRRYSRYPLASSPTT